MIRFARRCHVCLSNARAGRGGGGGEQVTKKEGAPGVSRAPEVGWRIPYHGLPGAVTAVFQPFKRSGKMGGEKRRCHTLCSERSGGWVADPGRQSARTLVFEMLWPDDSDIGMGPRILQCQ